ncbi:MAG TPA: flippase activity-associated protein Agl23 [Terracidiphilus sp.]|nr:flippase activity-associated protein Agl23 [Terracidiphilus sp.]
MENTPRSRWVRWPAFILIALIGLGVRLPQLGARPMHTDEAINAYIVGQVLGGESFKYDPQDRHGPALAAIAFPLARIQGAKSFANLTESELRLTSVVAGTIAILLFGAAAEMFGFVPSLIAALLFAMGPLPVYYDRYFIHESLFCAATFGLILSGSSAGRTRLARSAMVAGACAALMLACKETAILNGSAMAAAALVFWLWNRPVPAASNGSDPDRSSKRRTERTERRLRSQRLAWGAAVLTFLVVTVLLFTWFGKNANGLGGLVRAVPDVLVRAGGQGHEKPFWYYGQLLAGGWSGAPLGALACLGILVTIRRRDASPWQWLAYYGVFIAAIYSLIPYKTPWLALNLWLPLALFAGKSIEAFWRWTAGNVHQRALIAVSCILTTVAAVLIAHDTRQRVFLHPADENNPYAYAHTTDDILGLSAEIADLARREGIANPRIAVIAADVWPLPWYLRHFQQVGFWQPGQQVADADFFVTSTEAGAQYADRLRNFRPEFFGVRPGVLVLLWSPAPK